MLIQIADDIFEGQEHSLSLYGLLQRSLARRCYLSVSAPNSAHFQTWYNTLDVQTRSAWDVAMAWSTKDRALYRLRPVIAARVAKSDYRGSLPKVTIEDAIRLVDMPKRIWVENRRNDRAFWLAVMPETDRNYVEAQEEARVLGFENGGGISELRKILEEQVVHLPARSLTEWVLFDSDAGMPGAPSPDAQALIELCHKAEIPHFALPRRAIENYLPKGVLYEYANEGSGRTRQERRRKVDAFYEMTNSQRFHFHLKAGFEAPQSADEVAFYSDVPDDVRSILKKGISRSIAERFRSTEPNRMRQLLAKEGTQAALLPEISRFLNAFRVPYAR